MCPIWTVGSMHVATFFLKVYGGRVAGWYVWEGFSHGCFWAWSAFSAVPAPGSVNRVVDVRVAQGKCLCRTQRASLKIRPTRPDPVRSWSIGAGLFYWSPERPEVLQGGISHCLSRQRGHCSPHLPGITLQFDSLRSKVFWVLKMRVEWPSEIWLASLPWSCTQRGQTQSCAATD